MSKKIYHIKNSFNFNVTYLPLYLSTIFLLMREFQAPHLAFIVFYVFAAIKGFFWVLLIIGSLIAVEPLEIRDDLKLYKKK